MSACTFIDGDFSITSSSLPDPSKPFYYHNLAQDIKDRILDYELTVYVCEGEDSDKLEWFRIINIAGEELSEQEIRNAMYTGPWLTDAKSRFSKSSCAAYRKAKDYLPGTGIRQENLETALKWISNRDGCTIEDYMSSHQNYTNANELWLYFCAVIDWANATFPFGNEYKKGLDWGGFYNRYHESFNPDPVELRKKYDDCEKDSDVVKNNGIFEYLLSGNEKTLSLRKFSANDKRTAYARCGGRCARCGKTGFTYEEMQADHITPWSKGGHTTIDNLQMLCADCNRRKSAI